MDVTELTHTNLLKEPQPSNRDAQHWLSQPSIYLGVTSVSKKFMVEFAYFERIVIIAGLGAIALIIVCLL
ncbi:hypothetical protein BCD64_05335 [Nostoc sp. MBR 210]|nr:hypothetical protein BCD64_05335 [Nostoc sp. MBR 210]